jgi:RNA polymerase sigma factor (sigma-70 family)
MEVDDVLRDLVQRASARDKRAFVALTRRFQALVRSTAMAVLGDVQSAEDAAQETMLAAWTGLPRLADPLAFPGWLRAIARRQALRQRRGGYLMSTSLEAAPDVSDESVLPDRSLAARQDAALVLHWLGRLPANLREPALLYFVHDCSQQEVAAFLALPSTTVNNRLHAVRTRLNQRRLTMVQETLGPLALDDAFARRIGRLLSAEDGLVDMLFDPAAMPDLLTELSISDERSHALVSAQVTQRRPGGIVRAMPLTDASGIERGATVLSAGRHSLNVPLAHSLAAFLGALGECASDEPIETGIKVIDLLCPIPVGGVIVLVAERGTGLMVLMEELARRIVAAGKPCSLVLMVPPAMHWGETGPTEFSFAEALRAHGFSEGSLGLVESYFLRAPAENWSADQLAQLAPADVVISLTLAQAKRGNWPAIDPATARSRLIDQHRLPAERILLAARVRSALAEGEGAQSTLLQAYLTQPFIVAEPWSGRPGVSVSPAEATEDVERILSGALDRLLPEIVRMTGRLPSA